MNKRKKATGRSESGSFLALPHHLLESDNYKKLSPHAIKLLIDMAMQFRGTNNGDLQAVLSLMQKRGWRSSATLFKSLRELEYRGFIEKTRQGGQNRCNLYAITWRPIDECPRADLDTRPTRVASNDWKVDKATCGKLGAPDHELSDPGSNAEQGRTSTRVAEPPLVWGANQSAASRKIH